MELESFWQLFLQISRLLFGSLPGFCSGQPACSKRFSLLQKHFLCRKIIRLLQERRECRTQPLLLVENAKRSEIARIIGIDIQVLVVVSIYFFYVHSISPVCRCMFSNLVILFTRVESKQPLSKGLKQMNPDMQTNEVSTRQEGDLQIDGCLVLQKLRWFWLAEVRIIKLTDIL